uniref:uncharacterized protein LOC120335861 n=1 Tax=Styela clava TaxID=7725 RepID=UPI0019395796|nr:uncharacterized protein LOC120335861 [Styela clava]
MEIYFIYIGILCFLNSVETQIMIGDISDNPTRQKVIYSGFPVGISCAESDYFGDSGLPDFDGGHPAPIGMDVSYMEDSNEEFDGIDVNVFDENENPDFPPDENDAIYPDENGDVQCIIKKNSITIFNKTIIWSKRSTEGIFIDADESWDKSEIHVSATWGTDGGQLSSGFKIILKEPVGHNCATELETVPEIIHFTVGSQDKDDLACFGDSDMSMNKTQYQSIETVWYHGCDEISRDDPNFQYLPMKYDENENELLFASLKLPNLSFSTSPGKYRCALRRNGFELARNVYKVCLKQPFVYANNPSITPTQEVYKVEPGDSVTFTCIGHTGTEAGSLSQKVTFKRIEYNLVGEWERAIKCLLFLGIPAPSSTNKCKSQLHENKNYCERLTAEEIEQISNHGLDDNFTATYTIHNLNKTDNGSIYQCSLSTTAGTVTKNFTLVVEEEINTHNYLTVALSVMGALVLLAIIVIVFIHVYRIEVQYLLKKYFSSPVAIEGGYFVAYLVYEPSAYIGSDNIVGDVKTYLHTSRYNNIYDPNVEPEDAGAPVAEHYKSVLERCLRLVVIVTSQMIEQNEIEIFKVYEGLNQNVQKDLKLVFICRKEIKNEIKRKAKNGHNISITLMRFMKKQGSRVIYWKKNEQHDLNRALYVALPNVQPIGNNNDEITQL